MLRPEASPGEGPGPVPTEPASDQPFPAPTTIPDSATGPGDPEPEPPPPPSLIATLQAAVIIKATERLAIAAHLQLGLPDCQAVARAAAMEVISISPEINALPELRQTAWQAADAAAADYCRRRRQQQSVALEESLPDPAADRAELAAAVGAIQNHSTEKQVQPLFPGFGAGF